MTFFSHLPQISNFPLFSLLQYISPLFRENYYFPATFTTFPPLLHKFTRFLHTLRVFRFPYFYHHAFIHHPFHFISFRLLKYTKDRKNPSCHSRNGSSGYI